MALEIKNLSVEIQKKPVVQAVNVTVPAGKVVVLMGPNGSGKSSLANALLAHPKYTVTGGTIILNKTNLTNLSPDKRARLGLFLSLQHSPAIPGVSVANFLRLATGAVTGTTQNPQEFYKKLLDTLHTLKMEESFARRHVHVGFSGGERKRLEILQLLLLKPKYALLDEIDSGLDVDALKIVGEGIIQAKKRGTGFLIITHYNRILNFVKPDIVHVMDKCTIVKTGSADLALKIEKDGYTSLL